MILNTKSNYLLMLLGQVRSEDYLVWKVFTSKPGEMVHFLVLVGTANDFRLFFMS